MQEIAPARWRRFFSHHLQAPALALRRLRSPFLCLVGPCLADLLRPLPPLRDIPVGTDRSAPHHERAIPPD